MVNIGGLLKGQAIGVGVGTGIQTGIQQGQLSGMDVAGQVVGVVGGDAIAIGAEKAVSSVSKAVMSSETALKALAAGTPAKLLADAFGGPVGLMLFIITIGGMLLDSIWDPFQAVNNAYLDKLKNAIEAGIQKQFRDMGLVSGDWPIEYNIRLDKTNDDVNSLKQGITEYYQANGLIGYSDYTTEFLSQTIANLQQQRASRARLALLSPEVLTAEVNMMNAGLDAVTQKLQKIQSDIQSGAFFSNIRPNPFITRTKQFMSRYWFGVLFWAIVLSILVYFLTVSF